MSLRVLLLNEYFPPHAPGGAEWSLLRLAEALLARGHAVTVLAPDLGEGTAPIPDGLEVARFPFRHRLKNGRPLSPYVVGNPLFYARFGREAARLAHERRADILHAQNVHSMPAAVIAAMRTDRPAVATVRDYRMLCPSAICLLVQDDLTRGCGFGEYHQCLSRYVEIYGPAGGAAARARFRMRRSWEWFDWRLRRHYFRALAGVIYVGERIRRIHERAGLRATRQAAIHNLPPRPGAAHPDPAAVLARLGLSGRRIVLHAGRVSVGKGGRVLLEAATRMADLDPAVAIVLAGRVELADPVPEALRGRVYLIGHLSPEDLAALYQSAEIFVSAAVWQEPFSRAVLEAMQHGLPVVASDAGGNPEAVTDGATGLLVPRGDAGALAEAIARLLADRALARRLGEAGRRALGERFGEDALVERTVAFYREVLGARA